MDNFIGKWKQVDEEIKNIDAFLKAADVTDESTAEHLKNTRATMEYEKDGEGYKSIFTDINSGVVKEYLFKLGVPFESIDIHGMKFKAIITVENPNKVKETYSEWSPSEIIITREVDGDTLNVSFTANDVTATCQAKKM